MMKKFISAFAAISILAAFAVPVSALDISADSAIVIEASGGTVLYEKNPDSPMQIASTTKIMTALVALEKCSLNETVTVPIECTGLEGSSLYLKTGEEYTMRELLYGLMLNSGNDAAASIACHVAGSVEDFVRMMNNRAKEIGCEDTNFVNPHGLDAPEHHSTARDMAKIAAAAMENALFEEIVSTKSITINGKTFTNHNKLLWCCDGAIGLKTGYTKSSGRSLVSCVEREGMRLICVTLSAPDDWEDHMSLYEDAFSKWEIFKTKEPDEVICNLPVISGETDTVGVSAKEAANILVEKDSKIETNIFLPDFVYASVKKGEAAGEMSVEKDGKNIFSTELIFADTVDVSDDARLDFWGRMKFFFEKAIDKGMSGLGYSPGRG